MFGLESLIWALAAFLLIVVPVLAISAFVRVQRLERRRNEVPLIPAGTPAPDPRIASLDQRLILLEQRLAQAEKNIAAAHVPSIVPPPPGVRPATEPSIPSTAVPPTPSAPPTAAPKPPVTPSAPQATPSPSGAPVGPPYSFSLPAGKRKSSELDLETLIAGRWLNYVGILALLFAVAFFVKYAFENNWVGPRGRVAIGLLLGASLIPWSGRLLARGYRYFSEGIAGLGAAVLYLSLWSGWHYYMVFSQQTAFIAMIVVTAGMLALAVGRQSQRIAALAVAGGVLTPMLVSTGRDQQVVLFSYLAVLSVGVLLLARARDWTWLAPIQFIATTIYFWGWYSAFYADEKLLRTSLFATLFFLIFAALPVVRSQREGRLSEVEISIILANAFTYLLALRVMLWPNHRWTLTLAVLALAAAHLGALQGLQNRKGEASRAAQMLFAGLALTFVTLAIPIRLDGKWITIAWSVEGAVLVWSGFREKMIALRAAGLLLLGIAALRLAVLPIPAPQFLWNARFATFAVAVAAFAAAVVFANQAKADLNEGERNTYYAVGIAANVYALAALSLEAGDFWGRKPAPGFDIGLAQQLSLSVIWTIYATGLLLFGLRRHAAGLRWQALVLLGVVVGKVFLFDLSFLDRFYRIVSFLLLGVVLLFVSFYYQRKLAARGNEENP
ncbi:MAG: DUF2339 domain-containing protein [Candidatus Acidiferrales bacterium]